jgi:hypothetical protein
VLDLHEDGRRAVTQPADPDAAPQPDRDAPWDFTLTWDPERGAVPWAIMSLFRGTPRGGIRPGRATRVTDRGHATYYVKAVEQYLAKYLPQRTDIAVTAEPSHATEIEETSA